MTELSERELHQLSRLLEAERVLARKYRFYDRFVDDPQLKMKGEQWAARHVVHYRELLERLG